MKGEELQHCGSGMTYTTRTFTDAYNARNGTTYGRKAIQQWLRQKRLGVPGYERLKAKQHGRYWLIDAESLAFTPPPVGAPPGREVDTVNSSMVE